MFPQFETFVRFCENFVVQVVNKNSVYHIYTRLLRIHNLANGKWGNCAGVIASTIMGIQRSVTY